jgi:hypothetical protein
MPERRNTGTALGKMLNSASFWPPSEPNCPKDGKNEPIQEYRRSEVGGREAWAGLAKEVSLISHFFTGCLAVVFRHHQTCFHGKSRRSQAPD